jgi:phage-related holin
MKGENSMNFGDMALLELLKEGLIKILAVTPVKTISSIIFAVLLPHKVALLVLATLILMDTLLGTWYAIKGGFFTSRGMKKTLVKVILYSLSVGSVKALELLVGPNLRIIVETMFIYLSLIEVKSIFENLTKMGLPIPRDFLINIVKKIPFLGAIADEMEIASNPELLSLDKMMREFFSIIRDKKKAKLLKIKWAVWREFCENILKIKVEDNDDETFLQAATLESHIAMRVITNRWRDNNVDKELISEFLEDNDHFKAADISHEILDIIQDFETTEERKSELIKYVTNSLRKIFEDILKADS